MSLSKTSRRSNRRWAFAAAVLVVVPVTRAGNLYNLGALGASATIGIGVNAGGQVVGQSSDISGAAAFLYLGTPGSGGAMVDLGTLGGARAVADHINDGGQICGSSDVAAGVFHAFRYTGTPGVNGMMTDLGTLPGGAISYGIGINASGQVGGTSYTTATAYHAVRFNGTPGSGGSITDFGTLGGVHSEAYAINASGQTAGYSEVSLANETVHAFRTAAGTNAMQDLGTLGGNASFAYGMNDAAVVTGTSRNAAGDFHAFRYAGTPGSGGAMTDLGVLPGGFESTGRAIDAAGDVVGYSGSATGEHAFLYTAGKMIDLDKWLDATNPADAAKWKLTEAYGMNNVGMITGEGVYDDGPNGLSDGTRAFRLDASALIWRPGDADRDHDVDFTDLLTLAQNYGGTTGKTWTTADFTFDGAVTFSDLLLLAQNYGTTSVVMPADAFEADFQNDWALAQSLVPEPPMMLGATLVAGASLFRRRCQPVR